MSGTDLEMIRQRGAKEALAASLRTTLFELEKTAQEMAKKAAPFEALWQGAGRLLADAKDLFEAAEALRHCTDPSPERSIS